MNILLKVGSLLESLTAEECKIARQFLQAFEKARSAEDIKTMQLFDMLCEAISNHQVLNEEQVKKVLYKGNIGNKTFYRLLSRLQEKILESLILDVNLNRIDAYSEQYRIRHSIRKKTIQASILLGRGKHILALELYDKIIEKCCEFEIYDELIETLYLKQQTSGLRTGKETYENITKDIQYYELCRKAVFFARDSFHRVVINNDFKGDGRGNISFVRNSLNELQDLYDQTKSKTVSYYVHYLLMEFYQLTKAYPMACEVGLGLINLIQQSKALYMKRTLASAYIEVANNYLYLYSFHKCVDASKSAQGLLHEHSFNYAVANEIEFFGEFYAGNLNESLNIINRLIDDTRLSQSDFIVTKRKYLKACVLFMLHDHKGVNKLLEETKAIDVDKEGWNIGVRILAIMNDIEQGLDRLADSKIERIRKHVKKLSGFEVISPRNFSIRKLLYELSSKSYNYRKLYIERLELFQKLSADDGQESWQVKSPELIIFHKWFIAKMESRPYVQYFDGVNNASKALA